MQAHQAKQQRLIKNVVKLLRNFISTDVSAGKETNEEGISLLISSSDIAASTLGDGGAEKFSGGRELTITESLCLIVHTGRGWDWSEDDIESIMYYAASLADLLMREKISLSYKKPDMMDFGVEQDFFIAIVDSSPIGNHLDFVFRQLQRSVEELGKDGKVLFQTILDKRIQPRILGGSSPYLIDGQEFPNDFKARCGFRAARTSLIQKGVLTHQPVTSFFSTLMGGSMDYIMLNQAPKEAIRSEIKSAIMSADQPLLDVYISVIIGILRMRDQDAWLYGCYLYPIVSMAECNERKCRLDAICNVAMTA
jgi:hypothetical protein